MFRGLSEDIVEKIKLTFPRDEWARFGITDDLYYPIITDTTKMNDGQKKMARYVQAYKDERENKLAEERHRNAVFQKLQENYGEANSPGRKSSPKGNSPRRSPKGNSPRRSPTRKSPRSPTRKSPRSPTRNSPRSSRRSRRSRRSRKSRSRSRGRM